MAIQLRNALVGAFMALAFASPLATNRAIAQSDDAAPPSATNTESRSAFGNAFSRVFGSRDTAQVPKTAKPKVEGEPASSAKTSGFQAGFLRPFKAIKNFATDDSQAAIPEESSSKQAATTESKPAAKTAARPYREPFSKSASRPAASSDEEIPSNNSKTATSRESAGVNTQGTKAASKRASPESDAMMLDPPSIVGTGIPSRKGTSSTASIGSHDAIEVQPAPPGTRNGNTKNNNQQLPQIVSPDKYRDDSSSYQVKARSEAKSTRAIEAMDDTKLPPVSKKALPTQSSRNTDPNNSPSTGYALPNSRYNPSSETGNTNSIAGGTQTTRRTQPSSSNSTTSAPSAPNPPAANPGVRLPAGAMPTGVGVGASAALATPSAPATPYGTSTYGTSSGASPYTTPNNTNAPSKKSSIGGISETRLEMGVPKVRLYVSGPPAIQVGKSLPYEVILRNEGNEILNGVIVSMAIPATVKSSSVVVTSGEYESERDANGVESILWHVTELQPSQSRIFRVHLESLRPESFDLNLEWTVVPQTGHFKVDVQQPQLSLSIDGPTSTLFNKSELYRMRVRNTGNALAKDVDVKLTAEPYGSNQSKIGDIPAGGERLVEVELTFQKAGAISIVGEARSIASNAESKSQIDVVVNQVQLEGQWSAPPAQYLGSVMDYSIFVKNNSSIPAQNVSYVVTIPSSLKLTHTPPGCTVTNHEVRWTIPHIKPQENPRTVAQLFGYRCRSRQSLLYGPI